MDSTTTTQKAYRLLVVTLVFAVAFQPMMGAALASNSNTPASSPVSDVSASPDCKPDSSGDAALSLLVGRLDEAATIADNAFDGGSLLTDSGASECYNQEEVQNITHGTIYEGGLVSSDLESSTNATFKNHLDGAENVAQSIVDAEIDHAMRNNLTLAEARANINSSLDSYYVTRQKNLIEAYNTTLLNLVYLKGRGENVGLEQGLLWDNDQDKDPTSYSYKFYDNATGTSTDAFPLNTNNATLVDGNTTKYANVSRAIYDGTSGAPYYKEGMEPFGGAGGYDADSFKTDIVVTGPNVTDYTTMNESQWTYAMKEDVWRNRWLDIEDQHQRAIDNAMVQVEGVYSTYNYSEWTADVSTDALGCDFLASEYATDRNSTGYYSYASAQMACIGVNGSQTSTFTVTYTPDNDGQGYEPNITNSTNATLTGTLMTDWKPSKTNGSFVVETTYNTSNAVVNVNESVVVYFVAQFEDESAVVALDGEFTIQGMTDAVSGAELNSTTLDDQAANTWDAELTTAEINRLLKFDERVHNSSGGDNIVIETPESGIGLGNVSPLGAAVGAFVALGVIVVVGREFGS
jgi:hypothetical protein